MDNFNTTNDGYGDGKHPAKAYATDDENDRHQFNPTNFIKSIDDVNIGKVNKKLEKRNKEEEKDAGIHLSAQTRVLQLKHDSDRMDKLLVIKREEHEKRMKELGTRKQQLKEKRAQVKENYIKFNNYFEEMREKKEKTLERVKESQVLREQKNLEIIHLQDEMESLIEKRNSLKSKTLLLNIFERFLQRTASHCPEEFPEISDVIRKTDTLTDTRDVLVKGQLENRALLKKMQEDYEKYVQTKGDEILYLNLELVQLQKKYDSVQVEKYIQEKSCLQSSVSFDEHFVIIDNIVRTTENMERLIEKNKRSLKESGEITKSHSETTEPKLSTTEQIFKVVWNMKDLADIVKEHRWKNNTAH